MIKEVLSSLTILLAACSIDTEGLGDEEVPGVVVVEHAVNPNYILEVTEDGTVATFNVILKSRPASDVVITLNSRNSSEIAFSPKVLVFKPNNYGAPQAVTVTGQDDDVVDRDTAFTIYAEKIESVDTDYRGETFRVDGVNFDNEPD